MSKCFSLIIATLFVLMTGFVALPQQGLAKTTPPATTQADVVQKININTADEAMLSQLPGIGPKTATAIVSYRKENGNFKNLDDLLQVKGIGERKLAKIKPLLQKI